MGKSDQGGGMFYIDVPHTLSFQGTEKGLILLIIAPKC